MRHLRLIALLIALLTFGSLSSPAHAARCNDNWNLHAGSCGPRVAGLQWMLHGGRPNVFTKVKPTFKFDPNGAYGARTKSALVAYRFRLGYPAKGQCGAKASKLVDTAGPQLFAILKGEQTRPACWVALAQSRIKLIEPGVTKLAAAIRTYELSQVGVHETCGGSCNRGPTVDVYQRHFGLLGLAWCEIFQEYAFEKGGFRPIPFSPAPWSVIPTYQWAARHNLLSAKAKVGSLVAFLNDAGHIGYVIAVSSSGYTTVEGNAGDAVRKRTYAWGDRLRVFINLPGL